MEQLLKLLKSGLAEIFLCKLIINSSKIENDNLIDNFITEFDENYNVKRNIWSDKINIKSTKWLIFNPTIFIENNYQNFGS